MTTAAVPIHTLNDEGYDYYREITGRLTTGNDVLFTLPAGTQVLDWYVDIETGATGTTNTIDVEVGTTSLATGIDGKSAALTRMLTGEQHTVGATAEDVILESTNTAITVGATIRAYFRCKRATY